MIFPPFLNLDFVQSKKKQKKNMTIFRKNYTTGILMLFNRRPDETFEVRYKKSDSIYFYLYIILKEKRIFTARTGLSFIQNSFIMSPNPQNALSLHQSSS